MLDLGLSPEQELLQDAVAGLLDRSCGTDVVRAAEPLGYDPALWAQLRELGVVDMAVPASAGGGGAALLDAALVCELAGAALAPVPLVESIVAARLLARLGAPAATLLDAVIAGTSIATVALRPSDREGAARWVPFGAVADCVLVADGDRIVVASEPPPGVSVPNLGSLPVAHRAVATSAAVLAEGDHAVAAMALALQEWKTLMAALLNGAGRRALAIAVTYTTERHQFGVPIGSFQSIAHRLADAATAVDGSELLTREAAWAADEVPDDLPALSAMAYTFAAETATQVVDAALHFHGGYGFMLEYDIQLYFRRIKAWSLLAGDRHAELGFLAHALWGSEKD